MALALPTAPSIHALTRPRSPPASAPALHLRRMALVALQQRLGSNPRHAGPKPSGCLLGSVWRCGWAVWGWLSQPPRLNLFPRFPTAAPADPPPPPEILGGGMKRWRQGKPNPFPNQWLPLGFPLPAKDTCAMVQTSEMWVGGARCPEPKLTVAKQASSFYHDQSHPLSGGLKGNNPIF